MSRPPRKLRLQPAWPNWLVFSVAVVFAAWPLAIGWRSPELSLLRASEVRLTHWLQFGDAMLPVGLLRVVAFGLWTWIALGIGRALRAATGYTLAPSLVPLGAALVLVSPYGPLVLTDVRALPLLAALAMWLLALDLALAGPGEPRWKRLLSNLVLSVALACVPLIDAAVLAAALLLILLIPHRDRHRIGLVQCPMIGIAAGLAAANWIGSATPPWLLPLDALPAAWLIAGTLAALVIGLLMQRAYRQTLLTLVAVGALGLVLPFRMALNLVPIAWLAACLLTINQRQNKLVATSALALLVAAWLPSHLAIAQAHWQLETQSAQLKSSLRDEVLRVAKEQPDIEPFAWIPEPGSWQAGYESRTRLGWPGSLDEDLLLALNAPFSKSAIELPAAFGERALMGWLQARRQRAETARQPVLLLTCTFDDTNQLLLDARTLPAYAGAFEDPPIALAAATRQTLANGWTFSPPVPAHMLAGLRLSFGRQAASGELLVHFGDPLSAQHGLKVRAFDLPEEAHARVLPWSLVDTAADALGPPLTSIQITNGNLRQTMEAPELLIKPVFAYLIEPAAGALLDLSRGSAQPSFELFLDPQWMRPRRFELHLDIEMQTATGLVQFLKLSATGATLNKPTGEISLGPARLGPADAALESARRTWTEFVDGGLALRLQDAPPEGYVGTAQITLLGPGDLPIAETLPIEVRFRATPP